MNAEGKPAILESMTMFVPQDANRGISFTNKEAAFYFTQSHLTNHPEHAHFEGFNVAKNRIFGGYSLFIDKQKLDNRKSDVWVYPYKMLRKHGERTEELWMFDYKNVIEVSLEGGSGQAAGIVLNGEDVEFISLNHQIALFASMEGDWIIAVSSKNIQPLSIDNGIITSSGNSDGFYIAVGKSAAEATALIQDAQKHAARWKADRVKRMEDFLNHNVYVDSSPESLTLALNWLNLTMDQLVTRQQGEGIYAGLPWFNEYWGRDQFIALPGAALVNGQFETAKHILLSFAEFQDTEESSRTFGRVPNILAPQNIDYHTTDGTPRFIIQLQDYVKYSGDTAIITQLYPAVQNSIEGSIRNWVDDKGYLTHKDNETWMDARDAELNSYSPRDTRANDIQALWYNQLRAGVYFAEVMNDQENAAKWDAIAENLKGNFELDFRDQAHPYLADRLTAEGEAEFSLRPNQLFALDMLEDSEFKSKVIRTAWEELAYPWGVASLDRQHPLFHPFHLTELYHKDEAYHNGAVWTWLNGIAMQRMIEAGQPETAYKLFRNMNWQALNLGVVGGLSENLDAYPQEGEDWAKLTGAYLQAWSNAEQLRVWYQYFLGIQPDMIRRTLTLAPRIPEEIKDLHYQVKVGDGSINATYSAEASGQTYQYSFNGIGLTVIIDILPFEIARIEVESNTMLEINRTGHTLKITQRDAEDKIITDATIPLSEERTRWQSQSDQIFKDVKFAEPLPLNTHPVMRRYNVSAESPSD
ncbi:amylo-alpha-1,6-glucosidase [Paenibacillus sp. FSL L8-0463]|uniref:amylo-alpha-1,6-glucosidase n=1 Tax=Paenibacillus sp. FSL L8-0463 TaxID=2954687 RepID=UPI0031195F2C